MRGLISKTAIFAFLSIALLLSAGCFEKKTTNPESGNPEAPSDPSPPDGASNQPVDIRLSWTCTDPDGDPLTYDIYFGPSSFPPMLMEDYHLPEFQVSNLFLSTTYYWRIVARDDESNTCSSDIWSFVTMEDDSGGDDDEWEEAEVLFGGKYHPSITSDGRTMYMTDYNKIFVSEKSGDSWSTPTALPYPVNDTVEIDFMFSPSITGDGSRLYFSKVLPMFTYWSARKVGGVWQQPQRVVLDTTGLFLMEKLCISWDGTTLWFTAVVPPSQIVDIYYSTFDGYSWGPPQPFDEVNTVEYNETSMAISAGGNTFYFTSEGRSGDADSKSIWVTHKQYGVWQEPVLLGDAINMPDYEQVYDPAISYDGSEFYFSAHAFFPDPSGIFVSSASR
jgi:hypothetical protein